MSTTAIWNAFEKTDPAHTKPFTKGGGFKGTAINGTYIVKKLTAQFGPCGKGWRFVMEDERIEEGHTLANGDKAKVHIVRGHIEYQIDNVWYSTSPQFGQTMLVDSNKHGVFTDEEAPKKSITDCIAKCAVLLGVGADIHLGLFDDNKYVNQRKAEEAEAAHTNGNGNGHAEPAKRPVAATPADEAKKWVGSATATVKAFDTATGLNAWMNRNQPALDRLKAVEPQLYTDVEHVIAEQYARLSTLNG